MTVQILDLEKCFVVCGEHSRTLYVTYYAGPSPEETLDARAAAERDAEALRKNWRTLSFRVMTLNDYIKLRYDDGWDEGAVHG